MPRTSQPFRIHRRNEHHLADSKTQTFRLDVGEADETGFIDPPKAPCRSPAIRKRALAADRLRLMRILLKPEESSGRVMTDVQSGGSAAAPFLVAGRRAITSPEDNHFAAAGGCRRESADRRLAIDTAFYGPRIWAIAFARFRAHIGLAILGLSHCSNTPKILA